jgi:hypothetical protein
LHKWHVKAAVIFILFSIAETLQFFSIYTLATVFAPRNYAMYALGVVLVAIADRIILKRLFGFGEFKSENIALVNMTGQISHSSKIAGYCFK